MGIFTIRTSRICIYIYITNKLPSLILRIAFFVVVIVVVIRIRKSKTFSRMRGGGWAYRSLQLDDISAMFTLMLHAAPPALLLDDGYQRHD
jgi:hypothetical protein